MLMCQKFARVHEMPWNATSCVEPVREFTPNAQKIITRDPPAAGAMPISTLACESLALALSSTVGLIMYADHRRS